MTTTCQRGFDETLLSGYIDGELSQGERQRIQVHLDQCPTCRSLSDGLLEVRNAARSTAFSVPTDEQWRETARTMPSRWSRRLGWLFLLLCLVGGSAILSYEALVSSEPWWAKVALLGALGGVGLLFMSVLMDRIHDMKTDRYRRVQK